MLGYSSVSVPDRVASNAAASALSDVLSSIEQPQAEMAAEPFFPISRKLSQSLIGNAGKTGHCSRLKVASA